MAREMLPERSFVYIVLAAHGARMVSRPSLRGNAGGVRILVRVLHVLHERLAAEEHLVTERAGGGVGAADEGRMLLQPTNTMAYFRRVGAQTGLGGEAFAADVAVERAVFGALHLGVVISQVLLQVRQLDERPPAVGKVTFVWTFTSVQSCVLLDVAELLEAAIAVGTFVRLLAGVHPDVLD